MSTYMLDSADSELQSQPELLSVGAVAARLGVAPATVRSWGRRYGLVPAGRTSGGHRRYTDADLKTLLIMQDLVGGGASPAEAARRAIELSSTPGAVTIAIASPISTRERRRPGGPGGHVLSVPGGSAQVRGLARTASRLDADSAMGQLADTLIERGAVRTWDEVLRPVLRALGEQWARTGRGVDVEHVLSEATMEALRGYRSFLPRPLAGRPVLLACSRSDQHTLPLHILAAALAEHRIPSRLLGSRVPPAALASAARRTGASGIFVWRQLAEPLDEEDDLSAVVRARAAVKLVIGGPGWTSECIPGTAMRVFDLASAVKLLVATPR